MPAGTLKIHKHTIRIHRHKEPIPKSHRLVQDPLRSLNVTVNKSITRSSTQNGTRDSSSVFEMESPKNVADGGLIERKAHDGVAGPSGRAV